jgi:hypothetical protein
VSLELPILAPSQRSCNVAVRDLPYADARMKDVLLAVLLCLANIASDQKSLAKPAQFRRAYAIFDAVTGNLLMVGTLEDTNPPR